MEIHELRQDLIQRTNNNSFYNRGTNTEQCYKAYANEVIEWPISEVKKQKILDNLYKKYSKILEYESQHVPVMVAGPAKYNSKRLDKSEQILKASHELSEWFEDLRKQVENAKKDDSKEEKVKYIIDKVTLIHAVDRYSLLKEIEKQAAKRDLEMPVLIQVNIAKEESKHGFEVEEIDEVFSNLKDYPHVKVRGLMMMAPHIESSETEKYFKMTQELLQRLQKEYPMYQLDQLSMGMSNDYHEALNHGSTMIRIGSALFK